MRRRLFVMLSGVIAFAVLGAAASSLPAPGSEILLTVDGDIAYTNAPYEARFDRTLLEDLGLTKLRTWTPWTEGEPEFEGIRAAALLRAVGARGTRVRALARNDYAVTIPVSDFHSWPVLIAMRMNGQPLRLRDRGPLWIVYPWSDFRELDGPESRARSIWQLVRLTVQ
jgi:hypothetical protein